MDTLPLEILVKIVTYLSEIDRREFKLTSLKNLSAYRVYVNIVKKHPPKQIRRCYYFLNPGACCNEYNGIVYHNCMHRHPSGVGWVNY